MSGLPGGVGFGLGWMGALAGNIPKGQPAGPPGAPGNLAELLKLMQKGQPGAGLDPLALKKMLEAFGPPGGSVRGLSPMEMGQWVQLLARLSGSQDELAKLHPELDWAKLRPLLDRVNTQRAAGIDGKDLLVLKSLLERLTSQSNGSFGLQDLGAMKGLLDRINTGENGFPTAGGIPGFSNGLPRTGGATLESLGITPENIGRFTDFLKRMGLNTSQIEQLSNILSKIPAPGMQGDLGHWLARFDWDKLRPGKWQLVFPKWSRDWFERIRPNFGFLKGLRFPSFNFRPPAIALPNPGSVSLPSFSLPDRNTLLVMGGVLAALLGLLWGYFYLVRIGLAPGLKQVFGIHSHADNPDPVERFRLVYEGFALELLGLKAVSFHHQRLAQGLSRTLPGHDGQLAYLGELYERARYLPGDLRPTAEQAEEGLMALAGLVRQVENRPGSRWRS